MVVCKLHDTKHVQKKTTESEECVPFPRAVLSNEGRSNIIFFYTGSIKICKCGTKVHDDQQNSTKKQQQKKIEDDEQETDFDQQKLRMINRIWVWSTKIYEEEKKRS